MTKNLAAVLHGVDDLRVEGIAMPEPGAHEVLVEVQSGSAVRTRTT
jgi:NADPH:quinone reductase-like Zn-dependent oxidoreductase